MKNENKKIAYNLLAKKQNKLFKIAQKQSGEPTFGLGRSARDLDNLTLENLMRAKRNTNVFGGETNQSPEYLALEAEYNRRRSAGSSVPSAASSVPSIKGLKEQAPAGTGVDERAIDTSTPSTSPSKPSTSATPNSQDDKKYKGPLSPDWDTEKFPPKSGPESKSAPTSVKPSSGTAVTPPPVPSPVPVTGADTKPRYHFPNNVPARTGYYGPIEGVFFEVNFRNGEYVFTGNSFSR